MKGATMLSRMQNLGVIKSFSRPATSNDNPFSEALFKTVKYCASYPRKPFKNLAQAINWIENFTEWYNKEHRHSGIKFVTPYERRHNLDKEILYKRRCIYEAAKRRHDNYVDNHREKADISKWALHTVSLAIDSKTRCAYNVSLGVNLGCSNEKNRRRLSKEIRLI